MSGDDCLPVCLVNNMTLDQRCVALRQASNCEHVFHTYERQASIDEMLELKKKSTPASAASKFAASDQSESFIFA